MHKLEKLIKALISTIEFLLMWIGFITVLLIISFLFKSGHYFYGSLSVFIALWGTVYMFQN